MELNVYISLLCLFILNTSLIKKIFFLDCFKRPPVICDLFLKVPLKVTYDSLDCISDCPVSFSTEILDPHIEPEVKADSLSNTDTYYNNHMMTTSSHRRYFEGLLVFTHKTQFSIPGLQCRSFLLRHTKILGPSKPAVSSVSCFVREQLRTFGNWRAVIG